MPRDRRPGIPNHLCHATGCQVEVLPSLFMCKPHWSTLPKSMRDAVWGAYRPGQEVDKQPSIEYMRIAREAIEYLEQHQHIEDPAQLTLFPSSFSPSPQGRGRGAAD